jgi:hypothetical protein
MPNVGKLPDRDIPEPDRATPGPSGPAKKPLIDESEIGGSMKTEEPLGWDQAPQDIKDPADKRHPRPDGIGGLKDTGD